MLVEGAASVGMEWMNLMQQAKLSYFDPAIAREALIVQDQYMQQ